MKSSLDFTPKDREQRAYIENLYRLDYEPRYVEPPAPELYTVFIKAGKGLHDKNFGIDLWKWLDEDHPGRYASQGDGTGTTYYFDDPRTAFAFKMRFG